MKKIIITSLFIVTTIVNAQISKNLGDFNKVTAFDKISVKLIPSDTNKIEIKGNYANEVSIVLKDNELKIRMPLEKLLNGEDIVATVYFKKLEGIEANEGSYVSCDTEINSNDFSLIAKEGAQIKVVIHSKRITVKSNSGSTIKLSGETNNLDIVVHSGGNVAAEKCTALQAIVSVNAGGSVDVLGIDLVDAKTRAGGIISIYGKPKQVNQKSVLGGNIRLIQN